MGEDEALAAVGRSGGADPVTGESIVVPTEPAVERPKTGFEKEWEWLQGLHASPAEAMRAGFNFEKCHYPSARYVGSLGEVLRSMKADMLQSGPAGTFAVLKCECVLHPLLAARFELKWAEMKVRCAGGGHSRRAHARTPTRSVPGWLQATLHESMAHPMVVFHGTRASLHSSIGARQRRRVPSLILISADVCRLAPCAQCETAYWPAAPSTCRSATGSGWVAACTRPSSRPSPPATPARAS